MEYTALYRKYRPQTFEDVCGQNINVEILKKSIIKNKIGHAYLFAGTRGTGKTSVAKIFARSINCENNSNGDACGKCPTCKALLENDVDIIEIDAASNNGVDEIREITNNVKLVPSTGKYKVYIIDEVHMLSTGAFNALLKTLEEPPKHAVFILATTEIYKIPLTILSRCQRFDFKKLSVKTIIDRLEYIATTEKKKINKETLELIATLGDGSLRDSINILDQIINLDNINEEYIYKLYGNITINEISEFFKLIVDGDIKGVLEKIDEFQNDSKNLTAIAEKFEIFIRDILINNTVHDYFLEKKTKILEQFSFLTPEILKKITGILLELINNLKRSTNQVITFEIYMIEIVNELSKNSESVVNTKTAQIISREIIGEKEMKKESVINNDIEDKYLIFKNIRINNTFAEADKETLKLILESLKTVENYISNKKYNTYARILMDSVPVCAGTKNIIFSVKTIAERNLFNESYKKVESLIKEITKKEYKIICVTKEEWETLKKEYIINKKNNKKYEIILENDDIINIEKSDVENEAIELFGEDTITVN